MLSCLLLAVTCLASLENQNLPSLENRNLVSLENENEESAWTVIRGGKSLLGTFPFNARDVDDRESRLEHQSAENADSLAPPARQALSARDAKQVENNFL